MNRPILADRCSLSEQHHIDGIAERFEREWVEGNRGDLERYVRVSPPGLRVPLFRELLLIELVYRRRLGETPGVEEYARRFPHHAAIVADVFDPSRFDDVAEDSGLLAGRYRLEEIIGEGAFGIVHRATDMELGRSVALKLRRDGVTPQWSQQCIEEARLAARMDHPGIVPVFDAGATDDGTSYLVFQYVDGKTLREHMAGHPPVDERMWELFAQIADALDYAHRKGCVHRDLKPENVLIDRDGIPKIVDFGLAIHDVARPGRPGDIAGSPIYMSPEQIRGEAHRLDSRCDIWALGVMMFEAITGTPPFQADSRDELTECILQNQPPSLRGAVSTELEWIVRRCLEKDPSQRYGSAREVSLALRTAASRSSRRKMLVAAGVGSFTSAVAGIAGYLAWGTSPLNVLGTTNDDLPLKLDILSWQFNRWASMRSGEYYALRPGDQVRVHITSRQPTHPYLLWLDSDNKTTLAYPGTPRSGLPLQKNTRQRNAKSSNNKSSTIRQNASLNAPRTDQEAMASKIPPTKLPTSKLPTSTPGPTKHVELPAGSSDSVWTLEATREGPEAVILGVRKEPHAQPEQLLRVPPLPSPFDLDRLPEPWWFYNDRFQHVQPSNDRGINPQRVTSVAHPIFDWHRELLKAFENEFDDFVCVVFPMRLT